MEIISNQSIPINQWKRCTCNITEQSKKYLPMPWKEPLKYCMSEENVLYSYSVSVRTQMKVFLFLLVWEKWYKCIPNIYGIFLQVTINIERYHICHWHICTHDIIKLYAPSTVLLLTFKIIVKELWLMNLPRLHQNSPDNETSWDMRKDT